MIWIALFSIIFSVFNSSFAFPDMDKHVRKHVVEKSRKKQVLVIYKEDLKQRKSTQKVQKKHIKEFRTLFVSRNTTMEDLEKQFSKILGERKNLQKTDSKLKLETQNYINANEWELIVIDAKKDINKIKGKTKKNMTKLANNFAKFEEEVNIIITDESSKQEAKASLHSFEQVFSNSLRTFGEYMDGDSSLLYKHKTTSEEIIEMQDQANVLREEIFRTYAETHFKLKKSSTEEEWKLLAKKMKKFY